MLRIYAPHVARTTVSMEYEVPTLAEFEARFERITSKYPWLVWDEEGEVAGYAYADAALSRAGYRWDADMSIYLAPEAQHTGIGHALYGCLERIMALLGYRWLYALITSTNKTSCAFHERRGYVLHGTLRKSGFKFGRWLDVYWYALEIAGDAPPSAPPRSFSMEMPEWESMAKEYSESVRFRSKCPIGDSNPGHPD